MNRLLRILISLWRIEQLERRVAALESELTLRVAKLEAQAIEDIKRDEKALLELSRFVPEEKRIDVIDTALNISIARPWPT